MENITSLNSPHIERVKALIGSRGKKNRELENTFVAEGIQVVREALSSKMAEGLAVKKVYVTEDGLKKLSEDIGAEALSKFEIIEVSDQVMNAMADSESPQGILALCSTKSLKMSDLWQMKPKRIAFFWQIQDPGNAGAVIRTADAFGFNAIVFSDQCVDVYSPKVVRATAGSLWHIPVFEDVAISELKELAQKNGIEIFGTDGNSDIALPDALLKLNKKPSIWVFGNEARGLPSEVSADLNLVTIPMEGRAESLNLAVAATVVMYEVSQATKL